MSKNLLNRVYTSIILFFLLFLMIANNYFMGFFLIIIGIFSLLEFFKIILKIFEKNKLKQFFFSTIFIIYIFSFCAYFLILSSFLHLKILIFILLLTCVASDIGGFTFGKIFKGPKLTKISPNKTISGVIGSLIFSSLFILMITYYLTKSFDLYIIIIGCITSVSCQIGDLFFSFLKRKSFLKDSGNFLPGHGGVLDRIDGILLGIPIGFLSFLIFY
ncbi:phosphatidate cytidylyltransferase [Pelagibacterales bacterium SAG-MED05]|nr:phosphatidate cytidylyltransferase [Pelagibacterales bacterium SAG-MED05]